MMNDATLTLSIEHEDLEGDVIQMSSSTGSSEWVVTAVLGDTELSVASREMLLRRAPYSLFRLVRRESNLGRLYRRLFNKR